MVRVAFLALATLVLAGGGCRSLVVKDPFPCSLKQHCPAPYRCGDDNMCRLVPVMDGGTEVRDDTRSDRPDDAADGPVSIATGKPCTLDADCATKACVDGVCCENGCTGACKACAMTYTNQPDGTCASTTAGMDPHDDCTPGTGGVCGDDGMCDGAGACRKYGSTQVCVTASCTSSQFHPTQVCDGVGTCESVAPIDCGAYPCMTSGCAKPCTGDGDCPSGNYCLSSMCKAKKIDGDACTLMNECTSGHCVDGFCCDGVCTGMCNACSNAKTGQANGHCASVPAGQDPDNECNPGTVCGLDGTCNGGNGCRITPIDTPCGAATCTGSNTYTPVGTCDGAGTCRPTSARPCLGSLTCASSTACRTACAPATSATDCAAGNYCSGSTCVPTNGTGLGCGGNLECASGACVDGHCCGTSCGLATAAGGMCMGCSAATTGMPDGTCAARTGATTSACPAVSPTACVNLQTDPLNCKVCGMVCPTSGLPAGSTRACLFGFCGASCTTPGTQLCALDTGTKTCTPMVWGFEDPLNSGWGNSAETNSTLSTAQHHSGTRSLEVSAPQFPSVPARVFSLPCTPDIVTGTMDVRGKTFSAWIFVVSSSSSYVGTSCSLHAFDRNFTASVLPASAMKSPIVPGSWFQISTTFPTTSSESIIYQITVDCMLPGDWVLGDPANVWYVDDVQIN